MANTREVRDQVTAVILAGGRAQRMGGEDKGLVDVAGRVMISYAVDALLPQVSTLMINANRNTDRYRKLGHKVVADSIEGYWGPLAGMASAMQESKTPLLVTAPCDCPFVPEDLVDRLYRAMHETEAEVCVAHDGERMQPVFSLVSCELAKSLLAYLYAGERKIDRWFTQHRCVTADFSDRLETFLNVNTPEDVSAAETRLVERML